MNRRIREALAAGLVYDADRGDWSAPAATRRRSPGSVRRSSADTNPPAGVPAADTTSADTSAQEGA